MEWSLAALAAGLLTLADLDRTFYLPRRIQDKARLRTWYIGFIIGNSALATALYFGLRSVSPFAEWSPAVRAIAIGLGYLAIIRVKFTTFSYGDRDNIPFGFELAYEGAKKFVYKRINRIAKAARYAETIELANNTSLADLARRAKLSIDQDALMSQEEKQANKEWLLGVLQDAAADDMDKRISIANFVLSEQRST